MFCLTRKSSMLSADFFLPIEIGETAWEIGLIDFMFYNISNVEKGKNTMFYYGADKTIKLTPGIYEIADLRVN